MMKNSQLFKIIGTCVSVIGAIVLWFGFRRFKEATGVIKALTTSQFADTTSLQSISIWEQQKQTGIIIIIIGAVMLIIGIVFVLSGIFKANAAVNPEGRDSMLATNAVKTAIHPDIQSRLAKLDTLKDSGIITEEEYEEKRKKIINEI